MKILFINCYHSKKDYYNVFLAIKALEDGVSINEIDWLMSNSVMYETLCDNLNVKDYVHIEALKDEQKFKAIFEKNFKIVNNMEFKIDDVKFVLNLKTNDNVYDDDIYYYKYFALLKQSCFNKSNRYIYLNCTEIESYKLPSYLFLTTLSYDNIYFRQNGEIDKLTNKFAISSEWLPVMPISFELIETLRNPINFSNVYAMKFEQDKSGRVDFGKIFETPLYKGENKYLLYIKVCLNIWVKKNPEMKSIFSDKTENIPLLSLLLFTLQYMKGKSKKSSDIEINKLLDVSCDYGEGLLQLAENVVAHSYGGVLSIRLNDKMYKIGLNNQRGKKYWYLRMSVCDFSNKTIVDNIKEKYSSLNYLKLSQVFFEEENKDYSKHLNSEEHIIHHYGLMTFCSIITKNYGTFSVFSSTGQAKNEESFYHSNNNVIPQDEVGYSDFFEHHITGTDYDILLPVFSHDLIQMFGTETNTYVSSLPTNVILNRKKIDCDEILYITSYFDYFNQNKSKNLSLDNVQREYISGEQNPQLQKQKIIVHATESLFDHISGDIEGIENKSFRDIIVYFDMFSCPLKRIEAVCKIIMGLIVKFEKTQYSVHFILQDLDNNKILFFVRQFALFYRNNINNYMSRSQVYLQTSDGLKDVLFFTKELSTIYQHNLLMQLEHGVNSTIIDNLYHIVTRNLKSIKINLELKKRAIDFDSFPKCYLKNGEYTVDGGTPLFYEKLKRVVNEDIHNENLGCKICNTHIKANNIHLKEFFEAQILFGNAYWCSNFVNFVYNEIIKDTSIKRELPIVLYGYENYSEPMLFSIKDRLKSKGYMCEYIIYENSKFITPDSKSGSKIRHLDLLSSFSVKDVQIISIIGISTTLSTLKNMRNEILSSENIALKETNFVKSLIVFQLYPHDIKNKMNLKFDRNNKEVQLIKETYCGLEDGADNNDKFEIKAKYLINIEADWMLPQNCCLCFPEKNKKSYLEEQILINTNETSTVPTLLIKSEKKFDISQINNSYENEGLTEAFLNNMENQKYLYYLHINRGGNHYQYYIRSAALLVDELNNYNTAKGIGLWFKEIKERLQPNSDNQINVIVCPAHFSNETFATAVKKYIFDNNAYLINFDVRKEFRDTFEAKYSNYLTVLKFILNKEVKDIKVKFYYVDDQIITGDTFWRAKTLVQGLVSQLAKKDNVTVFESIITLLDRNSKNSRKKFFDDNQEGKFYSYLNFHTPSIRSYGDSCPICRDVSNSSNLSREASLSFTSNYWQNKAKQHMLIPLNKAKSEKIKYIEDKYKQDFKRMQCSEVVWNKMRKIKSKQFLADEVIYEYVNQVKFSDSEKMEYIISFYKVCSREHIIFQENINDFIFKILLDTYSLFTKRPTPEMENIRLYSFLYNVITVNEMKSFIYDLYCIVITRLCSLGSNWLTDSERLIECYEIGEKLFSSQSYNQKNLFREYNDKGPNNFQEIEFNKLSFGEFLSIQIKKSLFVNSDSSVKVKILNEILEKELNEYE